MDTQTSITDAADELLPIAERCKDAVAYARLAARRVAVQVAVKYGISVQDLLGECRLRKFVHPRQELYCRMYEEYEFGRTTIGKVLNRDTQTLWHGIRAHRARLAVKAGE